MKLRVRVPGKLILLGEYAVLEGADALVLAVDRYALVSIDEAKPQDDFQLTTSLQKSPLYFRFDEYGKLNPVNGASENQWQDMTFACQAIEAVCAQLRASGISILPFSIDINTSQFFQNGNRKLGLGSSAALITAIIFALAAFHEAQTILFPNTESLFHFCLDVHSLGQMKQGSGIDVAASIYGKIIQYNRYRALSRSGDGTQVFPHLPSHLHWLPVWTGTSSSTRRLLELMDTFRSENPSEYSLIMEKLSRLSNSGCQAVRQRDVETFMARVKEFYLVLQKLSQRSGIPIISPVHEQIAKIVYQAGGCYKPSGAGEGDLGIVFADSRAVMGAVETQLRKHKIDIVKLGISETGVHIG